MTFCEDCGEVEFEYGDRVRLVINHHVCGQVIGERNWSQEYRVRIVGALEPVWYERVELEPDPEFIPPTEDRDLPPTQGDDNIVHVDFTKRRLMTAETTTEGAA